MYPTINFTRGIPDPVSFPIEEMELMTRTALKKHSGSMLQYGPAYGYAPLREFLASWFKCTPANVLVGNGSLELFSFICEALLCPGDVVFVESPTYDRALRTLRRHDIKIVGIDIGPDGVELASLTEALKQYSPKLFYVIPDFQNPTGACMSLAVRSRIAELAAERGFLIVEDGPYGFLRYSGERIETIFNLAPQHTLHLSSFTKLISPGVRIGFMLGQPAIVQKVAHIAEGYYITPGYFAQGVIAEWCNGGFLDNQLKRLRALYAPRLDCAVAAVNAHLPGRLFVEPEGGFFLGLKLSLEICESDLLAAASECGLVLSSGNGFFPQQSTYRFLRLPFCALSSEEIQIGIERLAEVIKAVERAA